MPWRTHREVQADKTIHVWPDYEDHITDGGEPCWCGPKRTEYPNGNITVDHRDELDRLVIDPLPFRR